MTALTKEDKLQLIDSRMRNLEYRKYGLELDQIVENAKSAPEQSVLDAISTGISEIDVQLSALTAELAAVNALTE